MRLRAAAASGQSRARADGAVALAAGQEVLLPSWTALNADRNLDAAAVYDLHANAPRADANRSQKWPSSSLRCNQPLIGAYKGAT
jgi:hypothetical protein